MADAALPLRALQDMRAALRASEASQAAAKLSNESIGTVPPVPACPPRLAEADLQAMREQGLL